MSNEDATDHAAQAANAPTAVVSEIAASAISTDQEHAMIQFLDPQGKAFLLVMPVAKLASVQHLCATMRRKLKRKDLPVDQVVMQEPKTFMVGHSDQRRGVVAITFDTQLASEAVYVLPDEGALHMSRELERNVFSRMTPAERHAWTRKQHPLLMPNERKLIVPGV
jgi:hypothetical protein